MPIPGQEPLHCSLWESQDKKKKEKSIEKYRKESTVISILVAGITVFFYSISVGRQYCCLEAVPVGCSIGFLLVMLDGPTSVFVAGNLGGDLSIPFILTGVEVLVITL